FQPMKANFGLMPPLDDPPRGRRERARRYSARALEALEGTVAELGFVVSDS
ncbi:MAG: hypothetical protein HY679_10670, partial [Chloroflexi bacterium]|nr:hypothetical protein [Chloroflexota bacterium]